MRGTLSFPQLLHRIARFKNWGKESVPLIEPPRENRPTLEELKAKYPPNWGLGAIPKSDEAPPKQAPGWNSIVAMYGSDPSLLQRLVRAADDQHPNDEPTL